MRRPGRPARCAALVSIVLANTLIAASLVLFFAATRHLEKRQPPRADYTGWMLVLVIFMLFTWYTQFAPDMAARIVIMNAAASFLVGRTAWNVTRQTFGPRGWVVSDMLAALLWFLAFVLAITASVTAFTGEPSQDLFHPSVPLATLLAVNPLLILLIPLAVFAVVRRGQRLDGHAYVRHSHDAIKLLRDAFMARCDAASTRAQLAAQPLSFAIVDLDRFKQTATELGYPTADKLLHWVEEQIALGLRVEDELSRYSLDRFAVLMPNIEQSKALYMLDSIRKHIETKTCMIDGTAIKTTVSIGIARLQPGRTTAKELTSAAQVAVYRARANGRNSIDTAGDVYTSFDITKL